MKSLICSVLVKQKLQENIKEKWDVSYLLVLDGFITICIYGLFEYFGHAKCP